MNCLDYRRALLGSSDESAAMQAHRVECAACTAFLAEHAGFEAELRRGLEVPIPGGLEQRLLDRGRGRARTDRRRFLAAAGVAAAAAGVGLFALLDRNDPLALACIRFVMLEEAKSIMMGAMPRAEAVRVLADSLPFERIERIGQVRHVAPCPFNGGTAYHVVLAVPQDKVTLLVMPDARLPASESASYDGLYSRVVPLRKGSVGIVGANRAVVASVAGAVRG